MSAVLKLPSRLSAYQPRMTAAAFTLLLLLWGAALAFSRSPFVVNRRWGLAFFLLPFVVSAVALLFTPHAAFAALAVGLTATLVQTELQIRVGSLLTNAVELSIPILVLALLFLRWRDPAWQPLAIPGQTYFIAFVAYSVAMFAYALYSGISLENALFQSKGFVLYGLFAFILVYALRYPWTIHLLVGFVVVRYLYLGVLAIGRIFERLLVNPQTRLRGLYEYAPINIVGLTLMAVAVFCAGWSLAQTDSRRRWLGWLAFALLAVGSLGAVSRNVWLSYAVVFVAYLFLRRRNPWWSLLVLFILLAVNSILPDLIAGRILQLSDPATTERVYLYLSGFHAWMQYPLFGGGWGHWVLYADPSLTGIENAFADVWLGGFRSGLYPGVGPSYYHSEYVNLAVQTGAIGLGLYLAFWISVIFAARRWLNETASAPLFGVVQGSWLALIGLLFAALFEHVLWRADIGGLVGLFLGIMVAAMRAAPTDAGASP